MAPTIRYWYAWCATCDYISPESAEEEGGIESTRADRDYHLAKNPDHRVVIKQDTVEEVE